MATESSSRGIRGRASDLKAMPGDMVLDCLVDSTTKEIKGQSAISPKGRGDKVPAETKTAQEPTDRIKVAFYLEQDQRRRLDLLLAQTRPMVRPLGGRRLDQSALIRAMLDGILDDFEQHTGDPHRSLLLHWLKQ